MSIIRPPNNLVTTQREQSAQREHYAGNIHHHLFSLRPLDDTIRTKLMGHAVITMAERENVTLLRKKILKIVQASGVSLWESFSFEWNPRAVSFFWDLASCVGTWRSHAGTERYLRAIVYMQLEALRCGIKGCVPRDYLKVDDLQNYSDCFCYWGNSNEKYHLRNNLKRSAVYLADVDSPSGSL